jgi:hypothetical protein
VSTYVAWGPCRTCKNPDCEEQYDTLTGKVFEPCPNAAPIATDIYERKEMMAKGEAGNVYTDISHALETGNYQEFEDYFGDEDPFSYL